VEYANGASQSEADEKVCIFSVDQLSKFAGGDEDLFNKTTSGLDSDEELRDLFGLMVTRELRKRIKPGDVVAHVFGCTSGAQRIVKAFPEAVHVETGIGYSSGPFGAYRIFESEAWRAWHMGRYTLSQNGAGGTWPSYPEFTCTQVVPNYYREEDWALGDGSVDCSGDGYPYALWVGRLASIKGVEVVQSLARAFPELAFKCVSGDIPTKEFMAERLSAPNIEFLGRVSARSDLAKLYGGAVATVMPSLFWEPFGGVAVESLMCGTPVLCPDYAAFVETVAHVEDGVRCGPPGDYVDGLKILLSEARDAGKAGRRERRARAIERFGVKAVGLRYKAALGAIQSWHAQGLRPEGA
jgi:glycosyltransferase involved in cell wall biosynthesis